MTAPSPAPLCFSAMAGTFPGAPGIDALWDLLRQGQRAPQQDLLARWRMTRDSIHHPRPGEKDRVYLHQVHGLGGDEPERLVGGRQLAIGRAVLETLLAPLVTLPRTRTALIVATSWSDESYFLASADPANAPRPGLAPAEQVARLAGACGLGGPALTVDTACSSFIYAVDLAQGLMDSGQAEHVVVMALNTLMPPPLYLGFSQLTAFSPRAQLQAFGAEADGIVPGECAVAFLLEPLQHALTGARPPLGLMRALGLSADGAEGSVFTPGKQAQYTAYQRAWSGLDPASVGYIESHGTGTPLGDATEIGSLQRFFGPHVAGPIPLGSIKTNIGHTLAAAGGPALAKALLMLQHGTLPPQVAYPPSGKLADTCLRLVEDQPQPLVAGGQPLRIGLSSFGFGGANAHMVVEAYRPDTVPVPAPARSHGPIPLDLMVVEAEAALAGGAALADFGLALRQGPQAPLPFPQGRFGTRAPQVTVRAGQFLARDRVIDIDGYGMGPRPLAHVDPFKLLVTDRVGQLLKRLPGTAASDRTAMVMCCNLGGERFTNAYSEAERHYRDGQGPAPGIEVADVASMLPSLLSGYPAKFFDLRGFHQTLAGGAGLFWQTLLAAPHWFERGIDTLLLGAGRFISGASELLALADVPMPQGEGLGVLALRRYRTDGPQPPLLRLVAALPGSAATDRRQAAECLGIAAGTSVSICQVQADPAGDPLQALTGYLAEASGIATLLQALLGEPGERLIEVRDGEQVRYWLHAECLATWQAPAEPAPPRAAFTLRFALPHQAPAVLAPAAQLLPADPALEDGVDLIGLGDTLTRTLLSSLHLRSRALRELLAIRPGPLQRTPAASWRRSERNTVITHVLRRSPQSLNATLRVDEGHPYFFDHPLDHVPGILLIEGVLQLMEHAVPALRGDAVFISALNVRFQRYVMKERPVDIELQQDGPHGYTARVMQDEQSMCICRLLVNPGQAAAPGHALAPARPCQRQDWLHKARAENVLVGDIDPQARVLACPIPPGQFFEDGHPRQHSMVYFLEIARQAYMQIAHGALRIPLKTPMNLLVLDFTLARPIGRRQALALAPQSALPANAQAFKTNRIVIELEADGQPLGAATVTAQVLSRQAHPA